MFDLGWSELLVIGVVALIVVGPKDLPGMFRNLGRMTAKVRGMAREFTRAMEDAADEAGVKDVAKDLRAMTSPKSMGVDALKKATKFDDLDPFNEKETPSKKDSAAKEGSADKASAETAAGDKDAKPRGPETQKMTDERAEDARKIRDAAAKKAMARQQAESAAEAKAATETAPVEPTAQTAEPATPDAAESKA